MHPIERTVRGEIDRRSATLANDPVSTAAPAEGTLQALPTAAKTTEKTNTRRNIG
jgi:hypothetical protein